MNLKVTLSNLKIAPRKARLVVNLVRGKTVDEAERILNFLPKRAALPILKLLKSGIANAQHNYQLSRDRLMIKVMTATDGVTLKRFQPRAHGRATTIHKRWSIVKLELAERNPDTGTHGKKKEGTLKPVLTSTPKEPVMKTITDVEEVKKITSKPSLNLHDHAKESDKVSDSVSHGEKPQFKQRKTGAE